MTRARARDLAAAHLVDLLGEALGRSGTSADDASTDPVSRRRVRYAEDFMREHYGDIASLAEVAAAVGVHLRTLQGAFKAADRPSLRESLATIRLEAARARLLAAPPGTRVLDIALDCGIAHVGRFARAYARRYGETPSTTLRRASSTLGPAATRR